MNEGEVRNILLKEKESTKDLEEEIGKAYLGYQLDNIARRRTLLKDIVLLSAGVLTLTPLILEKTNFIKGYFFGGVIGYLVIILLALSYLRESLDKESWELQEQLDKYRSVLSEKQDIINRTLTLKLTPETLRNYFQQLANSKGAKQLKDDVKKSEDRKKHRKENPDYSTNLIFFVFTLSSFLLLSSIFLPSFSINHFDFRILAGVIVIIFYFTMSDPIQSSFEYSSKFIHFLVKKRSLQKDKN